MKINAVSRFILLLTVLLLLLSSGCSNPIPDTDMGSQPAEPTAPIVQHNPNARPVQSGDIKYTFEGSYPTLFAANSDSDYDFPYAVKFDSYYDVESYFNSSEKYYFYGARFTLACASFDDDFLNENDVVMLAVSAPSTYSSFISKGIEIIDGTTVFKLERHHPNDAPKHDGIAYHLVFTAPKGSFSDIDTRNIKVEVLEMVDPEIEDVYGAERYKYIYPEFWPFSHSTDPLTDNPSAVISAMETYEELLGFYESYKTEFDLDKEFLNSIGSTYTEDMFNDYVVMAAILPYDIRKDPPDIYDVFVYNLNVWISVSNHRGEIPAQFTGWRLLTVAVTRKNLDGVKLKEFYIES